MCIRDRTDAFLFCVGNAAVTAVAGHALDFAVFHHHLQAAAHGAIDTCDLLFHTCLLYTSTIGKQGTDLHTPNLDQAIIDQFLRRDLLDSHVQSIIPGYREKLELMLEELSSFPEGTRYTAPEGGLFIFVEMPEGFDATRCV